MLAPGQQRAGEQVVDIFVNLLLIVVAAVALVIVGLVVHRMVVGSARAREEEGSTLSDLRRMHREGQLTDEEFERAKSALIAHSQARFRGDGREDASEPPPDGVDEIETSSEGDRSSDNVDDNDAPDANDEKI